MNPLDILPTFVNNWFDGPSIDLPLSRRTTDESAEEIVRRCYTVRRYEETTDTLIRTTPSPRTMPSTPITLAEPDFGQDYFCTCVRRSTPAPSMPALTNSEESAPQSTGSGW